MTQRHHGGELARSHGEEAKRREEGRIWRDVHAERKSAVWRGDAKQTKKRTPVLDEEEAAANQLATDVTKVARKSAAKRLRWLQKALMYAAKNKYKPSVLYEIVADPQFVDGVGESIGQPMRAILIANLHVFTSKQQKALEKSWGESRKFVANSVSRSRESEGNGMHSKSERRHASRRDLDSLSGRFQCHSYHESEDRQNEGKRVHVVRRRCDAQSERQGRHVAGHTCHRRSLSARRDRPTPICRDSRSASRSRSGACLRRRQRRA